MNNRIKELEARVKFLENLIASLPGNIYWKDRNGVYLGCNNQQAQVTHLQNPTELIGKKIHDLLKKDVADIIDKTDKNIMASGQEKILEEPGVDINDNKAIYLTHKIPLYDENNQIVGLLGISFDITERKKMEKELRQLKAKAEQTQKEIVNYLANMHQELTGEKNHKKQSGQEYAKNIRHYFQSIIEPVPNVEKALKTEVFY